MLDSVAIPRSPGDSEASQERPRPARSPPGLVLATLAGDNPRPTAPQRHRKHYGRTRARTPSRRREVLRALPDARRSHRSRIRRIDARDAHSRASVSGAEAHLCASRCAHRPRDLHRAAGDVNMPRQLPGNTSRYCCSPLPDVVTARNATCSRQGELFGELTVWLALRWIGFAHHHQRERAAHPGLHWRICDRRGSPCFAFAAPTVARRRAP